MAAASTPHINDLLDEILIHIFSFCDVKEIFFVIRHVCQKWMNLGVDRDIWQKKCITLSGWKKHTFDKILPKVNGVRHVKIEQCLNKDYKFVPAVDIQRIFDLVPELEILEINDCRCAIMVNNPSQSNLLINNGTFSEIASRCQMVKSLSLGLIAPLESDGLQHLKGRIHLKSLSLNAIFTHAVGDDTVILICDAFPELIEFQVIDCGHLSDYAFKTLTTSLPRLQKLKMTKGRNFTIDGMELLKNMNSLTSLSLEEFHYGICDDILIRIAKGCKKLQRLSLRQTRIFTSSAILHLVENLKLRSLDLRSCGITNDCLLHIAAHCQHLEELDIRQNKALNVVGISYFTMDCTALHSTIRKLEIDPDLIVSARERLKNWLFMYYPCLRHYKEFDTRAKGDMLDEELIGSLSFHEDGDYY